MEIKEAIRKTTEGRDLTADEAYAAARFLMEGKATDSQISALLVSLHMKGETPDEIYGFAKAMRSKAAAVPLAENSVIDTCGTGGDGSGSFNISTLAAIVAAAAGCRVAKHGNRSITSRCGSADLLQSLGVQIELNPKGISACIEKTGIGFLFAPRLHPAMKHAAGPRKELGIRTIFNILGPLTNPAGARRQLIGVFHPALTLVLAQVLRSLGSEHVMVVHGEDGLDEISLSGRTQVHELRDGRLNGFTVTPEEMGFPRYRKEDFLGGDPEVNAGIARGVLRKQKSPCRDMVLMNAGAVIYIAGLADTIASGIERAQDAVDSGKARVKLDELITCSRELAADEEYCSPV
ncbi:anthranilate phosphoribosyltransferase [bacterium]|nr:anthranilate phosphoribosyltransferase [bacterium]